MRRFVISTTTALIAAGALAGCTAAAISSPLPTATAPRAATSGASTSATAASSPTASSPSAPASSAPASTPSAAAPTPSATALAQHVFDECSVGAAAAGVRLTFTAEPSGYTASDGHYQLVYPFEFLDGHDDPSAVYNCGLSDDTVTSTFLGGGLSDAH